MATKPWLSLMKARRLLILTSCRWCEARHTPTGFMVETSSRGSHRCATERRCEVGVVIDERHDAVEEVTDESTVEVVEKSSRSSHPRLVTSQDE